MIKITCCRIGKYPKYNMVHKGCFVKEFQSLNQFATWVVKVYPNMMYPLLTKELTSEQHLSLNNKVSALFRKKHQSKDL